MVADQLGRPMAILRMGSRVPSSEPGEVGFTSGVPPVMVFPATEALEEGVQRRSSVRPASAVVEDSSESTSLQRGLPAVGNLTAGAP